MKKVLVDSKVDPKVIAEFDKAKDHQSMFDVLERAAQEKIRELEGMAAGMKRG
jgi:hypothetical protein